jgi:asparagine synthase (glutamine-hydrolysing)
MNLQNFINSFFNSGAYGTRKKTPDTIIAEIHRRKLTYLPKVRMNSIANTIIEIENKKMPGILIETGCALGGSSILMASLKKRKRPLKIYDVFEMIPPPGEHDTQDVHDRYNIISSGKSHGIGGEEYYGYRQNLFQEVYDNFNDFGINPKKNAVKLIKGLLQNTLELSEPVAFAHIDVDWYDPVLVSLERIFPKLLQGGSIIIDDYFDWGGCRNATDEFLKTIPCQYDLDKSAGSLKITKT